MEKQILPIEFDCIDCKIHVYSWSIYDGTERCATCQWIFQYEGTEEEKQKLREFLKDK